MSLIVVWTAEIDENEDGTVRTRFEQTLDSLRELDKAETVVLERIATALENLKGAPQA